MRFQGEKVREVLEPASLRESKGIRTKLNKEKLRFSASQKLFRESGILSERTSKWCLLLFLERSQSVMRGFQSTNFRTTFTLL